MSTRHKLFFISLVCAVVPAMAQAQEPLAMEQGALVPVYAVDLISSTTTSTTTRAMATSTATTTAPIPYTRSHSSVAGAPDLILLMRDGLTSDSDLASNVPLAQVHTHQDLSAYARAHMEDNPHVESLALSSSSIGATYLVPAKLFGFISVSMPVQVEVDSEGRTAMREPWYGAFLAIKDGLLARLQTIANHAKESATAEPSGTRSLSPSLQAELLAAIDSAFEGKALAEAATSSSLAEVQ